MKNYSYGCFEIAALLFCPFLILSAILLPGLLMADEIIMKNGDRLSGEITLMDPSSVTMKLSYAGTVKIDRHEIIEIHTDAPSRVMLNDDTLLFGALSASEDGPALIVDSITGSEHKCALSDISYLNPPPHIAGEGICFTGEINFGGEFKEGNTISTKLSTDFKTQYDRGIHRYLFNGNAQWESKNRSKTEDNWFIQGRYNRLFAEKWYVLGNMSHQFDEFKGLMLRSVTGGGIGYRFMDEQLRKLSLEGGPNFVYENYKQTGKKYMLAFREGSNFEYPLFRNRMFFYHNHSVLQGISDTDTFSVRTSTGFKVPLGMLGLQSALQLDWDWDRKPSPGRQNSDTTVTVKTGYGW